MKITEIKIYLNTQSDPKLKAFASVIFDNSFVIRDLKIIEGNNGLFVAMPSRKAKDPCPKCGHKNVLGSQFCNECGAKVPPRDLTKDDFKNAHVDIIHPITPTARNYMHEQVITAYHDSVKKGVFSSAADYH